MLINLSDSPTTGELVKWLSSSGTGYENLLRQAHEERLARAGSMVYLRGLIELSNICDKNCFYCGIRKDNKEVKRYLINDDQFCKAVEFAVENQLGNLVIQSGELTSAAFVDRISRLLELVFNVSGKELGITLSCGEQEEATYRQWRALGATRCLLRIETSNPLLYRQLHPGDDLHSFNRRLEALKCLRDCGYQVGTGVMIGLPGQTISDLANDLLFMRSMDIDMCGMGPFIEHEKTPLFGRREELPPVQTRLELTYKMIALLRLLMPDINIASTTALQALDPKGRVNALRSGANVLMPNITPGQYREDYLLYKNKPGTDQQSADSLKQLIAMVHEAGSITACDVKGDSVHYLKRIAPMKASG